MSETAQRPSLSERERFILEAIVEDYISSGEPVGSRTITRRAEVTFSAATIRNVMSDLEALGFLTQPHTSAGRIPTEVGFRFYVDTLLKVRKPSSEDVERLSDSVKNATGVQEALEESTRQLSSLAQQTCVMLMPRRGAARFHHLDFLRLPDGKVLVIVVDQAGQVQNKILEPEQGAAVEQGALNEMAAFLNARCRGLTLEEARGRLLEEMRAARAEVNRMMSRALAMADEVLRDAERSPKDVILAGETQVLEKPEFADVDRIKGLLKAFEEKHLLVRMLDRIEVAPQVQVFIGHENRYAEVSGCSLVAAGYGTDEKPLGAIGVIGPVRMDYSRVVPLVEATARLMSRFLRGGG
ncbi:MAG: heat-inducible transcriptional repressor HrcA [Myxococcota bacterium]